MTEAGQARSDAAVPASAESPAGAAVGFELTTEPTISPTPRAPRLPRLVIVLCLVLAFRGALLVQQAVVFGALHAADCPVSVQAGLASTKVGGFEGCASSGATVAAVVGVFGSLLVAVPLLFMFRRMHRRDHSPPDTPPDSLRRRAVLTFAYLLALAAVAEAVAGSVVLSVLDHGEAAAAVERGVPLLLLVAAGLAVVALAYPTLKSTAHLFVVRFLGHDATHVAVMEKAVLVKLTVGVAVIAAARMILG